MTDHRQYWREPGALEAIGRNFASLRFQATNEMELQDQIAYALRGQPFEREVVIGPGERIDFVVHTGYGDVGIEVKTNAPFSGVIRQINRYATCEALAALIVVSTSQRLIMQLRQACEGWAGPPSMFIALRTSL